MQHPFACGVFEDNFRCRGERRGAISFLARLPCPCRAGIQMLQPLRTALLDEARGGHHPLVLWVLWSCPMAAPCVSLFKDPILAPEFLVLCVSEGREGTLAFCLVNEMEQERQGFPPLGQGMKARKGLVQTPLTELFSGSGVLWSAHALAISHADLRRGSTEVQS